MEKSIQINFALFLIVMLMINSCKKKEQSIATFIDSGVVSYSDPAVDGCGWSISSVEQGYYPINLDEKFQKQGLKVSFSYSWKGTKTCFVPQKTIKIHKIEVIN